MIRTTAYSVAGQQLAARARLGLVLLGAAAVALLCLSFWRLDRTFYAVALLALVWAVLVLGRWPELGFYAIVVFILLFDQYRFSDLNLPSGMVPVWRSYGGITAVDLLAVASFGSLILHRAHRRRRPLLRGGPLLPPALLLLAAIGWGLYRGITHQDPQISPGFSTGAAKTEMVALFYIPLMYIMAHTIIESPRQVRRLLWLVVILLGVKALQMGWTAARLGTALFDYDEIATHEDSLYISSLAVLALGLWACRGPRTLSWIVTALLPLAAVAVVANQRRAGFIALAAALTAGVAMLLTERPIRGRVIAGTLIAVVLLGAYASTFWNSDSPAAMPVYAFRTAYRPDAANIESNTWREMEKRNIERTIDRAPLLGLGFGRRYLTWYEQPSLDASGFTYWRYITHNAIYWAWIKMGAVGFVAFWYVMGSALMLGCLAFRRLRDGSLKATAMLAAGMIVMQMIFAYADLGLTVARSTAYLGTWLGVIASLHSLATGGSGAAHLRGGLPWRR
jgi:O-antigen ligase/polysaccharide polymerase Wzy-like membrane protein